MDPLCTRLS